MRFVIADDSGIPRQYAKRIIRNAGHDVVGEAENGREVVALCDQLRPDVAVLDVSMPEMNGADAAVEILKRGLAQHVIMASSQAQDAVVHPLVAMGCKFVAKPYDKDQLGLAIARLNVGDGA